MSRAIDADYSKSFLLPPAVEDWVPANHPARFIREFVGSLDLNQLGFKQLLAREGRPPYAVAFMLRLWLYACLLDLRSFRSVERACRSDLAMIWLAGTIEPDHNALWRFWRDYKGSIQELFRNSVKVAVKLGYVGFALQAVDGTKITARSSTRTALHQKDLEALLPKLDAKIAAMEAELAQSEPVQTELAMPEPLAETKELRTKIAAALSELSAQERAHMSPHEPDAQMMKNHSRIELAYNAQIVVDSQSGLIVAQDVSTSPSDQGQLIPMIEQATGNTGRLAEETVADGGYNTAQTIVEAETKQIGIILGFSPSDPEANPDKPYHSSKFSYDPQTKKVVCPRGQELDYEGKKSATDPVDLYRCPNSASCPVAAQCSKSPKGRTIEIGPQRDATDRQREKRRKPELRQIMRQRSAIVERPFAVIKHLHGYRRARTAGLENVSAEWALICLIYNLRVFFKGWLGGRVHFA